MLLFPVAGYVAKLVQQSQKTRMKQARLSMALFAE